jgi:sterol desaturase/sphingolipid hydroxylase (fatty acid hydroxylase superfamily)
MRWYSRTQFAIFRIIFGIYLFWHFVDLIPVCVELFSNKGVISDAHNLPTWNKYLTIFKYDEPNQILFLISVMIISSILFTIGKYRRTCSAILYFGWISLLNRNPLITNPSLGYIGWLLLSCILIPNGERLGFLLTKKDREDEYALNERKWEISNICFYGMWAILGVSYTASGLHKLQCSSWIDGTALYYVLSGPLARQNNLLVNILLSSNILIKIFSWSSLFLEISFMFFGLFYRTRKIYWFMSISFHIGILLTVNFSDLTFGMLMPHLFTFDASWFKITREWVNKYDWNEDKNVNLEKHSDIFVYDKINKNKYTNKNISSLSYSYDTENIQIDKIEKNTKKINNSENLKWNIATFISLIFGILINIDTKLTIESFNNLFVLFFEMYWGFTLAIFILGCFFVLERIIPDKKLNRVKGWWKWVILINLFQLFAVILATFTWEEWLQNRVSYVIGNSGCLHLRKYVNPFVGGIIAYLLSTWVFYWWHKARHEIYFLWVIFHQFHHSASRIETITSFYKHPLEIIVDSQIMALIIYAFLGLDKQSSVWVSVIAGFSEYFYHMNIKTPTWVGYFIQRPESHRCHHRYNKRLHCPNYADLPLWDILGATFENPKEMYDKTGFYENAEQSRMEMMCFRDVLFTKNRQNIFKNVKKFKMSVRHGLMYLLAFWGILNSVGYITHFDEIKSIGFVSVSSPLPLVFSIYNNIETFATSFNVSVQYSNDTIFTTNLDAHKYNLITGAYNRRNIYGAIFSHGAFFDDPKMIQIRQEILFYAICDPAPILKDFKIYGQVKNITVDIFNRINNSQIGKLYVDCVK